MRRLPARLTTAAAIATLTALAVTGCSSGSGTKSAVNKTLVVDNTFDLKTSDPARAFELTGSIVDKALYETALTFKGSNVTKPLPQLTTYKMSADNTTITLTLNGKHTFSNGDPVTIDDIVWSYKRVQGIKGNPSFLLANLSSGTPFTITKTSATTMTVADAAANPALPYILPNPSLGVLDSKLLAKHGGTTDKTDKAEAYLNGTSAGSGPYTLSSYDVKTRVVFASNPKYVGTRPAYGRVVLQNVAGPTQKINVQGGQAQIALNLNSDQASGLGSGSTKVVKSTSTTVGYMWLNQNSAVSKGITNNSDFIKAVRHGINYPDLLSIAGNGAAQPGGIVPSQFLGALASDPANSYDQTAAKAALKASGYSGQSITLSYPSDQALDGIAFATLAQRVQSQLAAVGIKSSLSGTPFATFIDAYRAGKLQGGLMYWGADYPDPSDYTVFSPGDSLGLRAGWSKDMAPDVTSAKNAASAAQGDARAAAYQAWQKAANADGPFIPLVQAAKYIVTTSAITGAVSNAVWTVDLAAVR